MRTNHWPDFAVLATKKLFKNTEGRVNQRKHRDYADYSIAEVSQNAEKIPEDLNAYIVQLKLMLQRVSVA